MATGLNPLGVKYPVQNRVLVVRQFLLQTIHRIEKTIEAETHVGLGAVDHYKLFWKTKGVMGKKSAEFKLLEQLLQVQKTGDQVSLSNLLEQADAGV